MIGRLENWRKMLISTQGVVYVEVELLRSKMRYTFVDGRFIDRRIEVIIMIFQVIDVVVVVAGTELDNNNPNMFLKKLEKTNKTPLQSNATPLKRFYKSLRKFCLIP